MKKSLILITVICTLITLTSCSNMLEDLRNAKNKRNAKGNTGIEIKSTQDEKKKTNRVTITVDPGDKEIDKTGYVFTAPETNTETQTKKEWKDAEEVFNDEGFKKMSKDSYGKYSITATENGDYTVAVEDEDGKTTYETIKVDNIIPVEVSISVVSSKEKGSTVKAVIKKNTTSGGEDFDDNSFDKDSFKIVCKDSSGNEITGVSGDVEFADGSMIITYTIPENTGDYDITVECNTNEYGEVSLGNDFKIYPGPVFTKTPVILEGNDKEGTAGHEGTYVLFGDWPQSVMPENTGIEVDESTAYEQGMFTYYRGQTSSGELAGWYVKSNENAFEDNYKYSDESIVKQQSESSERYFKLEPIKWRVLTEDFDHDNDSSTQGKALLLAENILTAGIPYYINTSDRTINNDKIYANNYEHSTIRAYLNGLKYNKEGTDSDDWKDKGFLQTAFSSDDLKAIAETTVINNARSTNPASNVKEFNNGENMYASDTPTTDKLFLLSMQEVTTEAYGFDKNYLLYDSTRIRKPTDFAKASGAWISSDSGYEGNGNWWLRSPYCNYNSNARGFYYGGNNSINYVIRNNVGVVPALSISLKGNTSNNGTASYTVKFDPDGGSVVPSQTVKKGEKAKEPDAPEKKVTDTETGKSTVYAFLGWYDGDELYDFSEAVNDNLNLKAKWLEGFVKVEGSTVEGGDKFTLTGKTQDCYKGVFREGRTVEIGDFYMCDHEVTQGEYEKYCLYDSSVPSDEYGQGKNYPAYYVSWYDAIIYCNLRSLAEGLNPAYYIMIAEEKNSSIADWEKQEGTNIGHKGDGSNIRYYYNSTYSSIELDGRIKLDITADGYRLPTEVEWEYAARGGKEGVNKDNPDDWAGTNEKSKLKEYAWYKENSSSQTHIVKSDKVIGTDSANTLGLYDMNGNVWEWCWDWYDYESEPSITADTPVTGVSSGSFSRRVNRGGSWSNSADNCSVAYRNYGSSSHPSRHSNDFGFRVVRSAQ